MMAEFDSTETLETESMFLDRALSKEEGAAKSQPEPEVETPGDESPALETEVESKLAPEAETDGVSLPDGAPTVETEAGTPETDVELDSTEMVSSDELVEEDPLDAEISRLESENENEFGHGGSGSGGAQPPSDAETPVGPADPTGGPPPQVLTETVEAVPASSTSTPRAKKIERERADRKISAARKSDQRDAIQSAGKSSGSSSGGADLPRSGFELTEERSQPQIRNLPPALVIELRTRIAQAAVREKGASEKEAADFAKRLSLGSLVIAFLMARLDIRLAADASTSLAAELFRSEDPLLGAALERIEAVQNDQGTGLELVDSLVEAGRRQEKTLAVIEQLLSYSVADKTENFLRGSHDMHQAPIAHKEAVFMRDRARAETNHHRQAEARAEGRPLR